MKRKLIWGLAALLMLVVACAGSASVATTAGGVNQAGSLQSAGDTATSIAAAGTTAAATEDAAFAGGPVASAEFGQIDLGRKVIRNAQLALESKDTVALFDQITALVEGSGGYIVDATIQPTEDDVPPVISATLRVPNNGLSTSLAAIEKLADEVVSKSLSSQDVTEEFVDIEARLGNLKALEVELRKLLIEVSDNTNADPGKLLQVYTEISDVRLQIEEIEGRKQALTNLVALATVQISIAPVPTIVPIVEKPWQPAIVAKGALADTVEAGQSVVEWGIRFGLNTLPILIVIGIPAWFVARWGIRRYRRMRPAPAQPAETV